MKNYVEARNAKELCKILGLPQSQAPKVEMRVDLAIAIKGVLTKRKYTHAEAAKKASVGRTVITAIMNGDLRKISTDRLIDIAHNLGLTVHLKVA
jgi:predicted XRE-type DNA-binding protein